jgi:uncharacterized protein
MLAPMRRFVPAVALASLVIVVAIDGPSARAEGDGPAWRDWTPAAFESAKREGKIVLAEVSASWCHWCHVMEKTTYADARVRSQIEQRFVPVKVDADARPDLAERYAEYHWPATVFLWPDGREILAVRGYREPDAFLAILAQVHAAAREGRSLFDASPVAAKTTVATADEVPVDRLRDRLFATVNSAWDEVAGGWGFGQKYPHAPCVEHALLEARLTGDAAWEARALRTLAAWESLIDPVWGGMYQYSEGGVWNRPHVEKIMSVQAGAISAFADAYRHTHDERWKRDANAVRRFLLQRLWGYPEAARRLLHGETLGKVSGAFMTSQDADLRRADGSSLDGASYFALDDAGRVALGEPRIDTAIYAQENGWAIEALCDLYAATLDEIALHEATVAAGTILSTHLDADGGWRHAAADEGPIHLGDQVAFGRGLLALHDVTGDPAWLAAARNTADAMFARLLDVSRGGFFSTSEAGAGTAVHAERVRPFEGNAAAARFLLTLHAATEVPRYRAEAIRALGAISDAGLPERFGWRAATALVAVEEATFPWVRVAYVGAGGEPNAEALVKAVLTLDTPLLARRMGAYDLPDDPMTALVAAHDAKAGAAIYVCSGGRCSAPIRKAEDLAAAIRAIRR